MSSLGRAGAVVVMGVVMGGCAAGIVTGVEEPVRPRAPVYVESLAVMPVTMETGSQGMGPEIVSELWTSLEARYPGLLIMDPDEVRVRLSETPAANEYAALMDAFDRTGVVESVRLERIASTLGVTHFLQLRGSYLRENFLDPYLWEDDLMREERQVLVVVARLWGTTGGGPLWEAVAKTRSETSEFGTERREPHELAADLMMSVVDRLPLVPVEGAGGR
jgi:hypothetical protein